MKATVAEPTRDDLVRRPLTSKASARERVRIYAHLANLRVYFHWAPVIVALSLLPNVDWRAIVSIALLALGTMGVASSGGALDDVSGFRDGIDQETYKPADELRSIKGKPIVLGLVSEQQALRFAAVTGAVGAGLGLLALVVAERSTVWLALVWLLIAACGIQYSYGLRFSYHGSGELVLGGAAGGVLLVGYVASAGTLTALAAFEAGLCCLWFAQVTLFSSTNDRDSDGAAGRMTIAARTSECRNDTVIGLTFALSWLVAVAAVTQLGPLAALSLLPCWILEVGQLRAGLGCRNWLRARALGWQAYRAGLLGLVAANLLAAG